MRFLLGVAEAGFFPGIILYLTYWFPAKNRARIVAVFMASVPLATVFGGPISGALLEMHGFLGLAGWHWLFLIEGLPAVVLGLLALKVLTDKPADAAWLKPEERHALTARIAAEDTAAKEVGYSDIGAALTRPRVLALGLLWFLIVVGLYGMGFWLPQVVQTYGLDDLSIGFITAIPYLFAAAGMVLWGRHSDHANERRWHIALPLFVAAAAFGWSAYAGPLVPTMIALTLAAVGFYAALGPFWSLPTAFLSGAGAAAGLALVNSIGNVAGFAGAYIVGVLREATGSFSAALLFLAAALALGGLMALLFREPDEPTPVTMWPQRAGTLPYRFRFEYSWVLRRQPLSAKVPLGKSGSRKPGAHHPPGFFPRWAQSGISDFAGLGRAPANMFPRPRLSPIGGASFWSTPCPETPASAASTPRTACAWPKRPRRRRQRLTSRDWPSGGWSSPPTSK